jgi:3-phosphoshikimate 1-carboxyvinyltransferase
MSVAPAHPKAAARPAVARRAGALNGRVRVPGDKSISHRALMLGLLTVGETRIEGLLEGADVLATAAACGALGAKLQRTGTGAWSVQGAGIGSLLSPRAPLDFGNAGTGTRLMLGVVAGHPIEAVFDGDDSLRRRPMRRVLDPLARMGAEVMQQAEGGRLPLKLKGARDPIPIEFKSPVASAQVKSAVLLCGLAAPGETTLIEEAATRDHTERMLAHFGAELVAPHGARKRTCQGPELAATRAAYGRSSSAAPASRGAGSGSTLCSKACDDPLRAGLILTLKEMVAHRGRSGARRRRDGRGFARETSALKGVEPAARAPSMIYGCPLCSQSPRPSPKAPRRCADCPNCASRNPTGWPRSPPASK